MISIEINENDFDDLNNIQILENMLNNNKYYNLFIGYKKGCVIIKNTILEFELLDNKNYKINEIKRDYEKNIKENN